MEQSRSMLYVALGDSLSIGVGTSAFFPGFVEHYLFFAETALKQQVYLQVLAKVGANTGEVSKSIEHSYVREHIERSTIITLTAGGNDLIQAAQEFVKTKDELVLHEALQTCKKNMSDILGEIEKIKAETKHSYIIRMVNLYNPFPDIDESDDWVRAFNTHLNKFSKGKSLQVADIYNVFKGQEVNLLSYDGIHPNARGYEKIAKSLDELWYAPLG